MPKDTYRCSQGWGLAASKGDSLIVVSNSKEGTLSTYSLIEGATMFSLMETFGGRGAGKLQFEFEYDMSYGGWICFAEPDCILVAEFGNDRVQLVDVLAKEHKRFYGVGVLSGPRGVAYCPSFIAVSESKPAPASSSRITLLNHDGAVLRSFAEHGTGPGQLQTPFGLRITADERSVVVADSGNHRICRFHASSGAFDCVIGSRAQGLERPTDVEITAAGYYIANGGKNNLVLLSLDPDERPRVIGKAGKAHGDFQRPSALAMVPEVGLIVRDSGNTRIQVLHL